MSEITFPYSPGFADVPDTVLVAENFAMGVHLGRIVENAALGMVRPEIFVEQYKNGDTVPTPVSSTDGYKYSRSELNYMWGIVNLSDPATGQVSSSRKFRFAQWFVNQGTGEVTCEKWYSENDASNTEKTNDGLLLVYTIAVRRKTSMFVSEPPYYVEHDDADFTTDDALHSTPLRDLNRNAKFSVVNTEAIYCGTYKSLDVVSTPVSPVDGYAYSAVEIIWLWSWVWTTNGDSYVAPTNDYGSPLAQMHRMDASVDQDGTVHTNIHFYIDHDIDMGDSFGRIAVMAVCQRGVTQINGDGARLIVPVTGTARLNWEDQFGGGDHSYGNGTVEIVFPGDGTATMEYIVGGSAAYSNKWGTEHTIRVGRDITHGPVTIPTVPAVGEELVIELYPNGNMSAGHYFFSGPAAVNPDGFFHARLSWPVTPDYGGLSLIPQFTATADEFAWVDSADLAAGKPVRNDLVVQLNKNIREAVCRPEFFSAGLVSDGDTISLPTSPIDSYAYSRDECIYLWEMADTGLNVGGMIRLNNWSVLINQSTGVVSISTQHIRDGGRFEWDNEGSINVKIVAVRSAAHVVPTPPSTDTSSGSSSGSAGITNGSMDSWSGLSQQIADGWYATDVLGTYAFSEQPGIAPVGSSQGIGVTTGAGNKAGIRTARSSVYAGDRFVFAYKAKSSVAITSGFIVRVKLWNSDATSSVYADVYSGALGTSVVNNKIVVCAPTNGATKLWTSLGRVSLSATLTFDTAWVDLEFHVENPTSTCVVLIDDVDWYRDTEAGEEATFVIFGNSALDPANDIANPYSIRIPGALLEIVASIKASIAEDITFDLKRVRSGTPATMLTGDITIPSGTTADVSVTTFSSADALLVSDKLRLDLTSGHAKDITLRVRWR